MSSLCISPFLILHGVVADHVVTCARAVAAARVVWHLARNPRVAMHLMRCNMVPILFQGLAKPDLSDPLPLIGSCRTTCSYAL